MFPNIKNDINDWNNFSKQQYIDDKNTVHTIESFIKKSIKKEEPWKNVDNVNLETNILHQSIDVKVEDVKIEPECDTSSEEQNTFIKHSPSRLVEFVEMQDIKIEDVDEFDKEDDPIKINEGSFISSDCETTRFRDTLYNQPSTSATAVIDKELLMKNDKKKSYQCDKCDNKYMSQKALNLHLRRHSGVGILTCPECNKQFPMPSLLAKHLLIHTGEKPYKCTQCEATFKQISHLKRHMLIHSGVRAYKCTRCDKAFTVAGGLTKHMRTHTGEKPFQCIQCGKAFAISGQLINHKRTHTGAKPFKCKICNQAFSFEGNLSRHMIIHTGHKPYQCTQCSKTFTQSCSLSVHMRSHTGEKPYQCSVCSQAFALSRNFKNHMKIHSNIIVSKP